jgi:inner membrane protein
MEAISFNVSTKTKLLLKALVIAATILILQIPAFFVQDLVRDRENRQKEAIAEVSKKWAGIQNIQAPFVVLPYWQTGTDSSTIGKKVKQYASIEGDNILINSVVTPQEKYRGIYKVILYNSTNKINGGFSSLDLQKLNISPTDVIWKEAYVQMNISDPKGLTNELQLKLNNGLLPLSPKPETATNSYMPFTAPLQVNSEQDLKNTTFSTSFNVNGSSDLLFTPSGNITSVNLRSDWPNPSFIGDILPKDKSVGKNGFTATWTSLRHNRMARQTIEPSNSREGTVDDVSYSALRTPTTAFGASLIIPVNGYQKTTRSIKYAALCILLTFSAFFLVEVTYQKSVHPFHYGLIGIALVLFYTLLLSFSEYIGFNAAYAVASVFTIALIAWFLHGILGSSRLSMLLSAVLVLIYTYVFTILQLQDYALLFGSLGLFITLGIIMHFTKKIQLTNV